MLKFDGGDLADWCWGIVPRNVDVALVCGKIVCSVDVDLGLPGSLNWVIGGELGLELAAIAAGGDPELDEYVLFVGRSCVLADGESCQKGCLGLSFRDASDIRVNCGTCSGAEDCTWCGEDGAREDARDEKSSGGIHVF